MTNGEINSDLKRIEEALADNKILYINGAIDEKTYKYNKTSLESKMETVNNASSLVAEERPTKEYWGLSLEELQTYEFPEYYKEIDESVNKELLELNESLNAQCRR